MENKGLESNSALRQTDLGSQETGFKIRQWVQHQAADRREWLAGAGPLSSKDGQSRQRKGNREELKDATLGQCSFPPLERPPGHY
jgi:hypothetical protein